LLKGLVKNLDARGGSLSIAAKVRAADAAEPAIHLIELYQRRGYRFIEYAQWQGKSYRSIIMSKALWASQL
jgi:hypothetical protein